MSPAVAQYSTGLGGGLGGLLNKVTKGGASGGGSGFMGPPSSTNPSQWDTYRSQPLKMPAQPLVFDSDDNGPTSPPPAPQRRSYFASAQSQREMEQDGYTRQFPPPLEPRSYTVLREVGDGSVSLPPLILPFLVAPHDRGCRAIFLNFPKEGY